ncbi:hypothetical protein BKA65DRAFT_473123 [Rhexocercosporidium sp. MPI-PUGE-AT-0058]|nr:hypothetical protein BKA65DRAFT_473123 [Rhexocercosporidium sp. MPI-PUGE-AT-0058]
MNANMKTSLTTSSRGPLTMDEITDFRTNISLLRSDHNTLFGAFSSSSTSLNTPFLAFLDRFTNYEVRLNALAEWIQKREDRAERGRLPHPRQLEREFEKYDGLAKDFEGLVEDVDGFRVELEGKMFHRYVVEVRYTVIGNQPREGNGSVAGQKTVASKNSSRKITGPVSEVSSMAASYMPHSPDKRIESTKPVSSRQNGFVAPSPEQRVYSSYSASGQPSTQSTYSPNMPEKTTGSVKLSFSKGSTSLASPMKPTLKRPFTSPGRPANPSLGKSSASQDSLFLIHQDNEPSPLAASSGSRFTIYDPASSYFKSSTAAPSEIRYVPVKPSPNKQKATPVASLEKTINPAKPTFNKSTPSTTELPPPADKKSKHPNPSPPFPDSQTTVSQLNASAEYTATSQLLSKILSLNTENAELKKENAALKKTVRIRNTTNRGLEGELVEAKARLERKVKEFKEMGLSDSDEGVEAVAVVKVDGRKSKINKRRRV